MSETTLLDRLRESELLSDEQLAELSDLPQARDPDPRALGKIVYKRGLLTRFQISQIAHGKGRELRIGPYLLLDRLGEGGMGAVYKARHVHLGRIVGLKMIRKDKLSNPNAVRRFYKEVQAAGQLHHPNIVLAFDAQEAGGVHFFAMEYVDGPDLARLVRDKGPLPVWQACEYIRQAALGLQHAHEAGLVHRDIKPSNLLVAPSTSSSRSGDDSSPAATGPGIVKVLDMGLALLADPFASGSRDMTREGQVLGTPDYLAPEQAVDAHRADARADIYGLGCTLYFLLTGRTPFDSSGLTELLLKHQMEEPAPLRKYRKDVPPALEQVLAQLMAKKPEQRTQTAAEVAVALTPFARGKHTPAVVTVPAPKTSSSGETWADLSESGDLITRPPRTRRDQSRERREPEREVEDRPVRRQRRPNMALIIGGGVAATVVLLGGIVAGAWALSQLDGAAVVEPAPDEARFEGPRVTVPGPTPTPPSPPPAAEPEAPPGRVEEDRGHLVFRGPEKPVVGLCLSADGQRVAAGTQDGCIYVWDLQKRQTLLRRARLGAPVTSLAFTPDNRGILAVAGTTVHQWDLQTGARTGKSGRTANVLVPDGKTGIDLAASGPRTMAVFRDLERAVELGRITAVDTSLRDACFPPGGQFALLLGLNDQIQLLEVPARRQVFQLSTSETATSRPRCLGPVPGTGEVLWGGSDGGIWRTDPVGIVNPDQSRKPFTRLVVRQHQGDVSSLACSPDGQKVLSGGTDRNVCLADLQAGRSLARFEGHTGPVTRVCFTPDGKKALSGAADATFRLWDLSRPTSQPPSPPETPRVPGERHRLTGLGGPVIGVHLVGGRDLFTAAAYFVRRHDLTGGKPPVTFQPAAGTLLALAVSPDGRRVVTGSSDAIARIHDAESGKLLRHLVTDSQVRAVAFSPDGRDVLTAGGGVLYRDGKMVRTDNRIQTGDYDLRLWNVESGKEVGRCTGTTSNVQAATFTADGRYVVATSAGQLFVWDRSSRKLLTGGKPNGRVTNYIWRILPLSGSRVLLGGTRGDLVVRDVANGTDVLRLPGQFSFMPSLAVSADGRRLLSLAVPRGVAGIRQGQLVVHDLDKGAEVGRLSLPFRPMSLAVDGQLVAAGESTGTAIVLDLDKVKLEPPPTTPAPAPARTAKGFEGHTGAVTCITFAPSGKLLATGGRDGTVRVWETPSGKPVQVMRLAGAVRAVRFSRDGSLVMAVGEGSQAAAWEATTGKLYTALPPGSAAAPATCVDGFADRMVYAVGFESELRVFRKNPTGTSGSYRQVKMPAPVTAVASILDRAFAVGDKKGQVTLWSAVTEKAVGLTTLHKGSVNCLVFDSRLGRLYSGGSDRRISMCVAQAQGLGTVGVLGMHEGGVTSLSLSSDGSRLASCSEDRTVRVWSPRTKRQLHRFDEEVLGVALSPDGRWLASCGERGIQVRDLTTKPAAP